MGDQLSRTASTSRADGLRAQESNTTAEQEPKYQYDKDNLNADVTLEDATEILGKWTEPKPTSAIPISRLPIPGADPAPFPRMTSAIPNREEFAATYDVLYPDMPFKQFQEKVIEGEEAAIKAKLNPQIQGDNKQLTELKKLKMRSLRTFTVMYYRRKLGLDLFCARELNALRECEADPLRGTCEIQEGTAEGCQLRVTAITKSDCQVMYDQFLTCKNQEECSRYFKVFSACVRSRPFNPNTRLHRSEGAGGLSAAMTAWEMYSQMSQPSKKQ